MTRISVGSTGSTGASNATRGSSASDDTAPSGFEELLAGANPARDSRRESVRDVARDSANDARDDDARDAAAAANAPTTPTGKHKDAEKVDGTDDSSHGSTAKPDPATDKTGLAASLAVPVPTVTPTTVPATGAPAAGGSADPATGATTPGLDATAVLEGTTDAPTTPVIDLGDVLANLPTPDPSPTVQPVLLPLPDLAPATATAAKTETSAATREAFTPPPATAPDSQHARPVASLAPPSPAGGAATFAPAPAPTVSAAMANVNVDEVATATVSPPPPSEQLVSVLTPLRTTQSGGYTLRLELKPPELGRVEMRVEMRDGVLHASIHAEHQSSAQQLRDALGDLRDRLAGEGVRTGDLTVSDGSVGSRHNEGGRASESPDAQPQSTATDELVPPITTPVAPTLDSEATSLLDVRV